jgi:hypothetical protein
MWGKRQGRRNRDKGRRREGTGEGWKREKEKCAIGERDPYPGH